MMVMVICLLMEKKSLDLKPATKMLTFQLNFLLEVYLKELVLLSFSESLTIKRLSLNDEPGMVRPNLIDVNPVELKYYPCMISLDNCTGICYVLISKNMCSKRNKRHKFNLI